MSEDDDEEGAAGPASDIAIAHPRESDELVGHEAAEQAFADAARAGRLHHAWLLAGPRGLGKATFAYRAARRLLGARPDPARGPLGAAPDDPVFQRVAAQGHPDLVSLERPWDPERGRHRGEIPVEEARRLKSFFQATPAAGGWRVAIVDAADELNASAANALLKTLEEPPPRAILILVGHAPGRIPATLRSRCRRLSFAPLSEEAAASVIARRAGLDAKAARRLAELAEGRPGEGLRLAAGAGLALADDIDRLTAALPRLDPRAADALAERLAARGAEEARQAAFALLRARARAKAAAIARQDPDAAAAWSAAWSALGGLERDLDGLHLDPKAIMLEALARLKDAAEGRLSA